jgi:hypothetical protein
MLESIGNTQPTDTAGREALYHQYQAFDAIIGTMEQYRDAAEAILALEESEEID